LSYQTKKWAHARKRDRERGRERKREREREKAQITKIRNKSAAITTY
jgi:hypothetical protein